MKQETIHPSHLQSASAVLEEILQAEKPADALLQDFFREHKNAGARDRAAISGLVYGVLRDYFPLRALLDEAAAPLQLCAAYWLRSGGALPPLREIDGADVARRVAAFDATRLTAAQEHNLPEWLWSRLERDHGADAAALARALNQPATVDLRVNTLKATREAAQWRLGNEGIAATPTPRSPWGLRLHKRVPLQASGAFRDGWVEPQDEGSQLLALHCAAQPGETVADFCAGAGGKTLALGAMMQNRGALHAFDVSRKRLARLEPRVARAGLTIVHVHALHDQHDPRLAASRRRFDAVLVDAPCSATGTLRRNPELRLRAPELGPLQAVQLSLLTAAAALVREGGRLVYATCSVLGEENEDVVDRFLTRNPFTRGKQLRLLPHRDGTDGFFAVTLVRQGETGAPR